MPHERAILRWPEERTVGQPDTQAPPGISGAVGDYGLTALPFHNSPDPKFLYRSPAHEDAWMGLVCAARHPKACGMGVS